MQKESPRPRARRRALVASLAGLSLLICSASAQTSTDAVARVLLDLKPTPGTPPADLNLVQDPGSRIAAEAYPSPLSSRLTRKGISSTITGDETIPTTSGGITVQTAVKRSEFEWRPPGQSAAHYQHVVGGELWVGFRSWIATPGADSNICYFQIGPVRDRAFAYESMGLYQLTLNGSGNRTWKVREYGARLYDPDGPLRIYNPDASKDGFTTGLRLNATGDARDAFSSTQEDTWVFNVRLRTDSGGRIRVWRNGERVVDSHADGRPATFSRLVASGTTTATVTLSARSNALANDYVRVKWGPYGDTSPNKAYYDSIRIAEDGGDDGYRLVAPANEELTFFTNTRFEKWVDPPKNLSTASVTGLPYEWEYDPVRDIVRGRHTATSAGARVLISYADATGTVIIRRLWAATGDAASDFADLDCDGSPNLLEDALGANRRSPSSRPEVRVDIAPDTGRAQITFLRALGGVTYVLEAAASPDSFATWTPLATNPGSVGRWVTVTDNQDVAADPSLRRFYRVRVSRP